MESLASPQEPKKKWFHIHQVYRALGGCAISQHPYHWPEDLRKVMQTTINILKPDSQGMFSRNDNYQAFRKEITAILWLQPAVRQWNIPKSSRGWRRFFRKPPAIVVTSSRFGAPPPQHDIIDIDALAGNIARQIWTEN